MIDMEMEINRLFAQNLGTEGSLSADEQESLLLLEAKKPNCWLLKKTNGILKLEQYGW